MWVCMYVCMYVQYRNTLIQQSACIGVHNDIYILHVATTVTDSKSDGCR